MSNASNLSTLANVLDDGSSGQFLKSTGSGGVAFDTVAAGAVVYATADLLPLSGNSAGDMAYVTATNRFYINNGSGWYSVSLVNTNPNITSVQDASSGTAPFTLATDGTATVITVTAADPEDIPLTYGYSVTTGNASLNGSTVAQGTGSNTNVFTVTPHASQEATFTITFTASDGINQATSANAFSLTFITTVADSNHTTLLATATSTGGNVTIEDSSTANSGNGHSITVNGDPYAGTFSPYRSGGYSTLIPNGDANNLVIADDASFDIYDGDFTVEAWLYPTLFNTSQNHWVSKGGNTTREWSFTLNSTAITAYWTTGGTSSTDSTVTVSATNSINEWMHICVKKSGSTLTIYKNGVSLGTGTFTSIYNGSGTVKVGRLMDFTGISHSFNGYISDLRIVKGTPITPPSGGPTERLEAVTNTSLLTCHLPYIADGSTNSHSITVNGNVSTKPLAPYDYDEYDATDHGGSVSFDGSNDDLTITDHSAFDLSTGNWTVEFWWNPKSVNANEGPMSVGYGSGSTPTGLKFAWENNKLYAFSMDGSTLQSGLYHDATAASLINRWNHVAAVYNGTNTDLYLNGVASGRAQSTNFGENSSDDVRIGSVRRLSSIHYSECSISDVRIVKGTAVYSGNFTPPTGPLTTTGGTYSSATNVNTSITASNTSLLIKGTDASIIDKSQGSNLKLVGTATGSTDQVRSGNWANTKTMKFDGNSDYIFISDDEAYGFGTDDWTIETWLYCTKTGGFNAIFDTRQGTGSEAGSFGLGMHTTGRVQMYSSTTSPAQFYYPTDTLSFNTWQHLAVVKNSGTTTMYFNGTAASTTYSDSRNYGSSQPVQIGKDDTTSNYFGGYMQDFRITKGKARYTAADETANIPSAPLEG